MDHVAKGHSEGKGAGGPPPAQSMKLKLPPHYKELIKHQSYT